MTVETVQQIGYHGTTQSFANKIIEEGRFIESDKPFEWLGRGIYFFVDRDHAVWWALSQAKRRKEMAGTVLAADITCKNTEILDLDRVESIRSLETCYANAEKEGLFQNGAPEFRSNEELQCFAVNLYRSLHPDIKLVAYTFDSPQTTRVGFQIKQRQLCVCDESIISDIRISKTMLAG